ncbi:MAG: YbgC/FadM family acyl-CoA thioesterase [Nitrospiraceae bacterium]|nr:YbgC/FadM family acyl-CoA thioesterase [Nitrospiraceae bacterium]
MKHLYKVRIYYEDTDCGGVVYYANYLRYFERARTELLEAGGISMKGLMEEGRLFVVAEAFIKYLSPGRYGDVLVIETSVDKLGPASIVFGHRVVRESTGERLVDGTVKLGCVGRNLRPLRLRGDVVASLSHYSQATGDDGE